MVHVFKVSQIFWPSIFEGQTYFLGEQPKYGASIKLEELPDDLRLFARGSTNRSRTMVRLKSDLPPRVVTVPFGDETEIVHPAQFHQTTFQRARDSNIPLDSLLTKIPMELAVSHDVTENAHGCTEDILVVAAIRVGAADLERRYTDLCNEYFKD